MKNKTILYILIIIILIAVVIGGLALLNVIPKSSQQNNNEASSTTSSSSSTPTAPYSNTTEEGYSRYTNDKYGFSIMYPTSLARVGSNGSEDDLDTSDIFVGEIPKDAFKDTNLYEVKIIAGAKKTDRNTCSFVIYGNDVKKIETSPKPMEVKINGITFTKVKISDAGAGNRYDTTRYSSYKNGICYELLAVAHSGSLELLQENDSSIKQYDESLFMPEFEEIVSFFRFTT